MNPTADRDEEILLAALALPAGERGGFLMRSCSGDPATFERVCALIEGYEKNSAFLETPAAEEPLPAEPNPGEQIGSYRLLEKIGEGGFGVVFLAEQTAPVRRRVALKLIRLGLDTREFIARFATERQALALMEHPNIARVFDAGATETGRPYLVMEFVAGRPITRYCDEHRLSLRARLELLLDVCGAIQHAHQKGIIHRDLKPSNILVATEADRPVPKLIDFGIAKATREPFADHSLVTLQHALIGTPAYTSPEQMDIDGHATDTRSDLYSLGALLYELVAGTPPFDREALKQAGYDEMRRIVREVEPPRPSARVGACDPARRDEIAARRSIDPTRLAPALRADLDWIAMRCLEKDPARRYQAAGALAADIRRHLNDEPVIARPPSGAYRLGKFVRRHRAPVFAAAVCIVSLVGALVAARLALGRETAARERAAAAERLQAILRRQAEEVRSREARQSSRALVDLATQRLTQGRTADALAYFVHAAQREPGDAALAPRLASILTSRSFLLSEGAVAQHSAPVLAVDYADDGGHLVAVWADGAFGQVDLAGGSMTIERLPTAMRNGFSYLATQRYLLIYCADGVIRILDRNTGRLTNQIAFDNDPLGCRVVPNATDLVTTKLSSDTLMLCDAATGRVIGKPIPYEASLGAGPKWQAWSATEARPTLQVRLRPVEAPEREIVRTLPRPVTLGQLATSPDGMRMVALQSEPEGPTRLQLWTLPEGTPMIRSQPLKASISRVRYCPDGRRLLCWGKGIDLFDADTLAPIAHLPAGNYIDELRHAFSPDGQTLATWANAGTVELWDLKTGEARLAPLVHGSNVTSAAFSRDGRILLTSGDGLARAWSTATGELLAEPTLSLRGVPAVALSPDGLEMTIGTQEGALHRFRIGRGVARSAEVALMHSSAQPLELARDPQLPAPFLPGRPARILWMGKTRARAIDLASGRDVGVFDYPEPIEVAFARKDVRVVVVLTLAGAWQAWWLNPEGAVEHRVTLADAPARAHVIFNPAHDRAMLLGRRSMRGWDLATGRPLGPEIATTTIQRPDEIASFNPDGIHVALGSIEGQARVWDAVSGRAVIDFGAQPTTVARAAFSPDGQRIVTGTMDGLIRLWDAAGQPLSPEWRQPGGVGRGVFSADGRMVATFAEQVVVVRDVARNGAEMGSIAAGGGINAVRFSPDGARLAIATDAGAVEVWEVKTGSMAVEPLRHPFANVSAVEFSSDGNFVRTETSSDDGFRFWSIPPPSAAGARVPGWLWRLATFYAGRRIAENGQLTSEPMPAEKIGQLRGEISALPEDAPYAAWGRWLFADPATRSIGPGFTVAPADAQRLVGARP